MKFHLQTTPRYWDIYLPIMKEINPTISDAEIKYLKEVVVECRKRGYEVIPSCENFDDKTGRCLGHQK